MDDLIEEFIEETQENLESLSSGLLTLEKDINNPAALDEIFRNFHTIKGSGGSLGFIKLQKIAHTAENILSKMRDGSLTPNSLLISLILKVTDTLKEIIAHISTNNVEPPSDYTDLISELENSLIPHEENGDIPSKKEQIKTIDKPQSTTTPPPTTGDNISVSTNSIRVKLSTIDNLVNTIGELVLVRNQLLQSLKKDDNSPFLAPLKRLSKITTDLHETVMKTRMQPIKNIWSKLPRTARDLCIKLEKQAEIVMIGEQTELDRQVLELITDPFIHLIRNSLDHGIESPEEREKMGKNPTGKITLEAFHQNGHIIISINDDGRGIDSEKLRAKTIKKGLLSESEASKLSDDEINQYIFKNGVSTSANVSEVSGRGVGMDVVITNITKIGGTISLSSSKNVGTSLTIKIPLTLAVIPALIIKCAEQYFAIPQSSILDIYYGSSGKNHKVSKLDDDIALVINENVILPLISLTQTLELGQSRNNSYTLVLQSAESIFGLMVDDVRDMEDIVLKPMSAVLNKDKVFSGNTILGNGKVVMILDPNGLNKKTPSHLTKEDLQLNNTDDEELTKVLIFKNLNGDKNAVTLDNLARIDKVSINKIERSIDGAVVQYKEKLIPVIFNKDTKETELCLIVFKDESTEIALATLKVIDLIQTKLTIQKTFEKQGFIGSAIINDETIDIVDAEYYLNKKTSNTTNFSDEKQSVIDTIMTNNKKLPMIMLISSETSEITYITELLKNDFKVLAVSNLSNNTDTNPEVIIISEHINQNTCLELAKSIKTSPSAISSTPMVKLFETASKQDVVSGIKAGILRYIPTKNKNTILQSIINLIASRQSSGRSQ